MSNSKRSRRQFTTEQKVAILKRHMVDKGPRVDPVRRARASAQRLLSLAEADAREPRRRVLDAGGLERPQQAQDHRLPRAVSSRRLPPVDVHDDRPRGRRRQSVERVPRARRRRLALPLEQDAVQEGLRLRPTATPPRALAHRHLAPQPRRHVLLPMLDPRWRQSCHRALGDPRPDDRARRRMHSGARPRGPSRRAPAHHLGQRPAVHRQGLQGVHPSQGHAHVRTAPYYPQSNGKIERCHKTIKTDAIRPGQPQTLDEARALVARWVNHYNTIRLHSAIGYITPADRLADRGPAIWAVRDARLEAAREVRRVRRAESHQGAA